MPPKSSLIMPALRGPGRQGQRPAQLQTSRPSIGRDGAVETSDSRFIGPCTTFWAQMDLPVTKSGTFEAVKGAEPQSVSHRHGAHVTQPPAHFRALVFCLVFESPHQIF